MFILQPVLTVMSFLRDSSYFLFNASCLCGKFILLFLTKLLEFLADLAVALQIIAKELYRFLVELHLSITEIGNDMSKSTNNGIEAVLEAVMLFLKHMQHFFKSTKLHSQLLATRAGHWVGDFFTLLFGGLLLIGDCFWWMLTIIPKTLFALMIGIGDVLVFTISSGFQLIVFGITALLENVFRLTIAVVVLFLMVRHRERLKHQLIRGFNVLRMYFRRTMTILAIQWTQLRQRMRLSNRTADNSSRFVRRSPVPRNSRSPSQGEKLPESQRCVVCRDQLKCVLLLPCKHLCLCEECAEYLVFSAHNLQCPLCRQHITQSLLVYI